MDQIEFEQKMELFGKGFAKLKKTLKGIPEKAWDYKPAENEWSIREVIVHLVDSESNAMLRARVVYAENGRTLMAYDQDLWVGKLAYAATDTKTALQTLKWVRKFTYDWLQTVNVAEFVNSAVHPEYSEPYTFDKWLGIYTQHIYAHIDQIKSNYALWKKSRNKK